MSWRLGVAVPMLAGVLGCAASRPTSAPPPSRAGSASSQAAPLDMIAGEYVLVTIDRHTLPYPPAAGSTAQRSASWPVLSGTLSLRSNGTFHIETTYGTETSGTGKNSYEFTGTCFSSGDEFTMVWDGGGQTGLSTRGDTLVMKNEGRAFSYLRR